MSRRGYRLGIRMYFVAERIRELNKDSIIIDGSRETNTWVKLGTAKSSITTISIRNDNENEQGSLFDELRGDRIRVV